MNPHSELILKIFYWAFGALALSLGVVAWKADQERKRRTHLFDRYLEWRTQWQKVNKLDRMVTHPSVHIKDLFPWPDDYYESDPEFASASIRGREVWLIHERLIPRYRKPLGPPREWYFQHKQFIDILMVYVQFNKRLPGRVKIGSTLHKPAAIFRDQELESGEFNRQTYLFADPRRLGPAVFPPDLMERYLRLKPKPWITIQGNACAIMMPPDANLATLDQYVEHALEIVQRIEHSGALEPVKKSEPLFPRLG